MYAELSKFIDTVKVALFGLPPEIDTTHLNEDGLDWAEAEMKKQADYLAEKRQAAIEYLGDRWVLKGGEYNRTNTTLGQK